VIRLFNKLIHVNFGAINKKQIVQNLIISLLTDFAVMWKS